MAKIEDIKGTDNKEILICYQNDAINKIIEILNQIEVKGITNVTGLAAIMNLLNAPAKTIEGDNNDSRCN